MPACRRLRLAGLVIANVSSAPALAGQMSPEDIAKGVANLLNEGSNPVHATATGHHVDVDVVTLLAAALPADKVAESDAALRKETVRRICTLSGFRHSVDLGVDYTYTFRLRSPEATTVVRVDADAKTCAAFDAAANKP